jgi:hypothetical protein
MKIRVASASGYTLYNEPDQRGRMTKSISVPLDRKATRQLQSNWIRNKHQSLTKNNENTIFHDSHAKYRLPHIMRKQ